MELCRRRDIRLWVRRQYSKITSLLEHHQVLKTSLSEDCSAFCSWTLDNPWPPSKHPWTILLWHLTMAVTSWFRSTSSSSSILSPLVPRKQSRPSNPTAIDLFIYCLRPNQHLEMSGGAMRGNQATNSGNINPICERGNEIFPFIFNWSLSLFVSIHHPPVLPLPVRVECVFLFSLHHDTVSVNITLRWIPSPGVRLSAPEPFCQKWKCVWFTELVHLQGW